MKIPKEEYQNIYKLLSGGNKTFSDIANIYGCTRERVRQIFSFEPFNLKIQRKRSEIVEVECPFCKNTFTRIKVTNPKYCSRVCARRMRMYTPEQKAISREKRLAYMRAKTRKWYQENKDKPEFRSKLKERNAITTAREREKRMLSKKV